MTQDVGLALALAKQNFDELTRLIPPAKLAAFDFGDGPARPRAEQLLSQLVTAIGTIERHFAGHITESGEPPIVTISTGHLSFYREVLEPNISLLRKAHLEITGLAELLGDLFDDTAPAKRSTRLADTLSWGVEKWATGVDEDEKDEWFDRGFDLDGAMTFVASPIFQPDEWAANQRVLQPVLMDRPAPEVRNHIRVRLTEIYKAFTFGLWMAAVALCRSVVEFSIKDRASALGIEVTKPSARFGKEDKRLAELIDDVATKLPSLKTPLETVRDTANRVLHPKKRDVIALPSILRDEALNCVKATKLALEELYRAQADVGSATGPVPRS